MMTFRIGELAKLGGVGIETVRFYERQGLLAEPKRKSSGYRQYDEQTVQVLKFIRRAKELGFTLKEIKSLLELRTDVSTPRTEIRQQARNKVAEIDAKITDLQRMREGLQSLIDQCHGNGSIIGCPILNALEDSDSTAS